MSKKVLKKTQYSLMRPLRGKGNIGDLVFIKPGYGRYLEKLGFAIRVNAELLANLDIKKNEWLKNEQQNALVAKDLLKKIANIESIQLTRRVSQGVKLYAAVKKEDIVAFFLERNIKIEKENVKIDNIIKTLGEHFIIINVYGNEEISMKVVVSAEQ